MARRHTGHRDDPPHVRKPGDFDLDVDRRDWDTTYGPDLGA
jgi:hypothetical protein